MSRRDKPAVTEALYNALPEFACIPGCTDCCGPVHFNDWEWAKVKDAPRHDHGPGSLTCPFAVPGVGCTVHDRRPYICRMYGNAEALQCPHGRGPKQMIPEPAEKAMTAKYLKTKPKLRM